MIALSKPAFDELYDLYQKSSVPGYEARPLTPERETLIHELYQHGLLDRETDDPRFRYRYRINNAGKKLAQRTRCLHCGR